MDVVVDPLLVETANRLEEVEVVEVDVLHLPSTLPPGVGTVEPGLRTGKGRRAPSQVMEEQGTRPRLQPLPSRPLRLHPLVQLFPRRLCAHPECQFYPTHLCPLD